MTIKLEIYLKFTIMEVRKKKEREDNLVFIIELMVNLIMSY